MEARWSTSAGSCTARSTVSSYVAAGSTVAPAAVTASRRTVARSGTSVPGVQTPTHTSAPGSWRSTSSDQTTVGNAATACMLPRAARRNRPRSAGVRTVRYACRHSQPSAGMLDVVDSGSGHATFLPPRRACCHAVPMPRAADLPVRIGLLPSGPTASVLDVPGVGVGHATVWRDEADPPDGRGVARTGVTVLDPGGNCFRSPVPAGGAVLNGAGECTG